MVPVTLNNYEAADLSLQSTLKLGAYNEKGSLYSSQILAEDMGLEIEADLWTR